MNFESTSGKGKADNRRKSFGEPTQEVEFTAESFLVGGENKQKAWSDDAMSKLHSGCTSDVFTVLRQKKHGNPSQQESMQSFDHHVSGAILVFKVY